MNISTIIPKRLTHGEEIVILRREEYERIKKTLLETQDVLSKIARGEKELREGKTRTLKSLEELRP